MERQAILDKVEELWWLCQDRNIGSNEAELDFRETITNWIKEQFENLDIPLVSDPLPVEMKLSWQCMNCGRINEELKCACGNGL